MRTEEIHVMQESKEVRRGVRGGCGVCGRGWGRFMVGRGGAWGGEQWVQEGGGGCEWDVIVWVVGGYHSGGAREWESGSVCREYVRGWHRVCAI
jgi:hypothetical protein